MNAGFNEIINKINPEYIKSRGWFRKDNLIVLVLLGVLLFIIALPTKKADKTGDNEVTENTEKMSANESDVDPAIDDYAGWMEERLEKILSRMEGVGKVKVMVTLASSEELVLEKDKPSSRTQTDENDNSGGTREITQMENNEETIYATRGNNSEPYVVKTLTPKVEGVVVVAQGSGKGSTDKNITEIVQALFGLEAHKVKVVKMSGTN